jgi:hypothetical protein
LLKCCKMQPSASTLTLLLGILLENLLLRSSSRENSRLLCNSYDIHKSLVSAPILRHINPAHTFNPTSFISTLILSFNYTCVYWMVSLPHASQPELYTHFSSPHTWPDNHFHWFDPRIILGIQYKSWSLVCFSSASWHVINLTSKCSLQQPVLKHYNLYSFHNATD